MTSTSLISVLPNSAKSNDQSHFLDMAVDVESSQAGSIPDVIKSQPGSQPLGFDGLLNESLITHFQSNQATSIDVAMSEQHHPDTHTVDQRPNQSSNSLEGLANIQAPVSYVFLGSQHGAVTRQQEGVDEMKIQQKHCSHQEHLKELHQQHQDKLFNQYCRQQQQLEQLMSSQKQSLGDQISPLLYESYLHELSNFEPPSDLLQQMEEVNRNLFLLPGNYQNFNLGSLNWLSKDSPSLQGSSNELLASKDPSLVLQVLAFTGALLDPSINGPSFSNIRDAALQTLDLHPSLQGTMLEVFGLSNNVQVTSSQAGQPIACDPALGASIVGDHRAQYFDRVPAQNDASYVGQQATGESLYGQNLDQSFPQTTETCCLLSNLQQGNAVPRNLQYQDFIEKQQEQSLEGDVGKKDNLRFGLWLDLVKSRALLETVFCNPQESGCHKFDSSTQSTSAGQHVPQGDNKEGDIQILNNLASRQHGSWSALMQSAVAEISSVDAVQQNCWSGSHEQVLPNEKQQNSWDEQNIQLATSLMGSFYLATHVGSKIGVHGDDSLLQTNLRSVGHLCSRIEGIQHNNQSNFQSRASSQSLHGVPIQASGWENQSLHQAPPRGGSNLKSYAGFEDMHKQLWKPINTEQVLAKGSMPSPYVNFDGRQQNSSWCCGQGCSETKTSDRMSNSTLNEHNYHNDNEAWGSEQNIVWLSANRGCKHANEDVACSRNGHLENLVHNMDELSHNRGNDTFISFPLQMEGDDKMKAVWDEQFLQQETICLGISPQDSNIDNLQNNLKMHQQRPQCNSQLFGSNHATLQNYSDRHQKVSENSHQLAGSNDATWDSMAKNEGTENTSIHQQGNNLQVWDPFLNKPSLNGPSTQYDLSRAQYSHDGSMVIGEIVGQLDPCQQSANTESDSLAFNEQKEYDLKSIIDVTQQEPSLLSWKNNGPVSISGNEIIRMVSKNVFQCPGRAISSKQQHKQSVGYDSSLGVLLESDMREKNASRQIEFEQAINSSMNTGMDVVNTRLQIELKERPEAVFLKGISSGHAPAWDRSLKVSCLNKTTCLSSSSENLSKAIWSNESSSLKNMACTGQDVSTDQCISLALDVSPSHICQTQLLSPFSSQQFSQQILQHGQPLLLNSCSCMIQGLDVKGTYSANENENLVHAASAIYQDSSTPVSDSNISVGWNQSSTVALPAQPSRSSCELLSTGPQERVVDVRHNNSDIGACDMCVLEAQVHDLQNTNGKQQVTSIPQASAPRAVDQGQFDIQGIFIPCTHKMRGSPCVTSWMVNSLTTSALQKESEVKSTFSTSNKSSSKIGSPVKLFTREGSALDHQGIAGGCNFGNEKQDPSLQESRASSGSDPSLISGMSQPACFSKLLSNLKILANHQRKSIGAGKIFPGVFESFRPLFGRLGNHTYSLLPKSDGHMSYGNLITEKSVASMCTESYSPHIINSQYLVPAAELTKQELSLQQKASDMGGSNGMLASSSSSKDVSMKIVTLLPHTSAAIPEVELQSQAQELILMPNIHSSVSASVASPIHSIVHSYNQEQTKAFVDRCPHLIPISACPSSQHKNTFTSAGSILREDSGFYALGEQYPQLDRPMPFPLEQNNEDKKTVKMFDIADAGCGSGLSLGLKCKQQAVYPHDWPGQVRIVSASSMTSSPEDATMLLSFSSSQGNKDYSLVNNGYSESSTRVNGMHQVSPQLADLGMLQLGSTTNEKLLALQVATMYQRMVALGRSSVITPKQFLPGKHIDHLFPGTGLVPQFTGPATEEVLKEPEPRLFVEISKIAAFSPTEDISTYHHSLSKSNIRAPVAVLPKKRKKVILPLIPWHIEISEAGDQLPTMSDVELAWATVTDRLPEKDEDDVQPHDEEAASISRAKRRLKLATQLMQHLIPPLPTAVMSGKAIAEHEGATYILAKTALGDACRLGSGLRAFGQLKKFRRLKDNSNLRMVENFTGRAKDLHNKLRGLETSSHVSDLRSEYQDLERLCITNRLAKHHARSILIGLDKGIAEGTKSSSNSSFSMHRPCPRRYVTAVPMPRILPEGVPCYSL